MTRQVTPGHGPKQQPNDAGDETASRGSTASNGYWVHDDLGPKTYVPVNPGDGADLTVRFERLLTDFPDIAAGQATAREADGTVWLEGRVNTPDLAAKLEDSVRLIAGGLQVQNRLSIGR